MAINDVEHQKREIHLEEQEIKEVSEHMPTKMNCTIWQNCLKYSVIQPELDFVCVV